MMTVCWKLYKVLALKYVCVYSALFYSQYAQTTVSLLDDALPRFFWRIKSSFCTKINKKVWSLKRSRCRWGKENKKWLNAITRKNSWRSLFSSIVLCQDFSCYARCLLSFGATLLLADGWALEEKQMEDYSWSNCLCPANAPPSAQGGSLRLSSPQQGASALQRRRRLNMTDVPSLTFTSLHTSSLCFPISYRFACRGRIIYCDIIMDLGTHKSNINLLIFNINFAAVQ